MTEKNMKYVLDDDNEFLNECPNGCLMSGFGKFCENCGQEMKTTSKKFFCGNCGKYLGHNPKRFCKECGNHNGASENATKATFKERIRFFCKEYPELLFPIGMLCFCGFIAVFSIIKAISS